jgi:hypothetical protein
MSRVMQDLRLFKPGYLVARGSFRCLVCLRFVMATNFGVCPSCGIAPPQVRSNRTRRDPVAWERAGKAARALSDSPAWTPEFLNVLGLVIVFAGLGKLLGFL